MQSVEIPVVTQTRVGPDYAPSSGEWMMIGDTTIIAYAMGLAVFKDVRTFVFDSFKIFSMPHT